MGTEVGIFWMIVLIIAAIVFISGTLLFGSWILTGSFVGFPFAIHELTKSWNKIDTSDKIKYICLILIGVFGCIYAIVYLCL